VKLNLSKESQDVSKVKLSVLCIAGFCFFCVVKLDFLKIFCLKDLSSRPEKNKKSFLKTCVLLDSKKLDFSDFSKDADILVGVVTSISDVKFAPRLLINSLELVDRFLLSTRFLINVKFAFFKNSDL
jgi:hypothetical protein